MPFAPPARAPIAQVAGDASTAAALDELAAEMRRAKQEGRMIQALALDAIDTSYLVRDRMITDEEELQVLMGSIQARGQQTPIEVVETAPGTYGLISGLRRLTALERLYAATNDAQFATVQALIRQPETAADAYVAMVEENEIRVGLSYYERARIAAKAVDQGIYATEKDALLNLFSSASRTKRSKIRNFLTVYQALDARLRFPMAIGERLGMSLAKALENDPGRRETFLAGLKAADAQTADQELACLNDMLAHIQVKPTQTKRSEPNIRVMEPGRDEMARGVDNSLRGIQVVYNHRTLTLSGPAVTEALRRGLMEWLRSRG